MFNVPTYCLEDFLELASHLSSFKELRNWVTYIDAINQAKLLVDGITPFAVHTDTLAHLRLNRPFKEYETLRNEVLTELFTGGVSVQAVCADRVTVKCVDNNYVVSVHSIGRLRKWCWINQSEDVSFPTSDPMAAMVHVANMINRQKHY